MNNSELLLEEELFVAIKTVIEKGREEVAIAVNSGLTAIYWQIGKRINEEILNNKRADYGKHVLQTLSKQLREEYGSGWSVKQLQHCLYFVDIFPDIQIVSTLWRHLSWSILK